jgi:hypothetical protein
MEGKLRKGRGDERTEMDRKEGDKLADTISFFPPSKGYKEPTVLFLNITRIKLA